MSTDECQNTTFNLRSSPLHENYRVVSLHIEFEKILLADLKIFHRRGNFSLPSLSVRYALNAFKDVSSQLNG